MIATIIIVGILLLLGILLLGWIKITVIYDNELRVKVGYLFISYTLFPKKQKPVNPKKFTYKNFRKMRLKEEKARLKAEKKNAKKDEKSKKDAKASKEDTKKKKLNETVSEAVSLVKDVVVKIIGKFAKKLRIDISEFRVIVASPDSAQTAIEYGVVSQTVQYIFIALSNLKHTRFTEHAVVDIRPDFNSDKPEIAIRIRFRLRLANVISLGFSAIAGYIKHKLK